MLYSIIDVYNFPLFYFFQRWYHDGSVKCFSGGHIGLTFLALLVILYSIATMFATFLFSFDKSEKV